MREGLIDVNPFGSMKISLLKGTDEDTDVNPFSKQERDLIIQIYLLVVKVNF